MLQGFDVSTGNFGNYGGLLTFYIYNQIATLRALHK